MTRTNIAVVLGIVAVVAVIFFVPFIPDSIPGPAQLPCYYVGTCPEGMIHFTISFSCYLTGFSLGDSYSPQVTTNGNNLYFGCGGPVVG